MKSEKQGRNTFYNMMVLEGFIAMVWAAGAMGVYNLALQSPEANLATGTVGVVCKYLLGHVGGIIALIGVIVLPITSGDTALRALRLSLSETMHIDQSTNGKRIRLALPIFILVIAILVWAKVNSNGFMILWRYFAWANQTLALFALMCIAVWMFENGKAKWAWMPMIPGGWYAFICVTYIANAHIGFNIPWTIAYIIGVACAVAYVVACCLYGKKRAAKLSMNSLKIFSPQIFSYRSGPRLSPGDCFCFSKNPRLSSGALRRPCKPRCPPANMRRAPVFCI